MGVCHFYGGEAARHLSESTGLIHRGGLAFLEYTDEADQHWTLIVNGEVYRTRVMPFLPIDGDITTEQTGDFDWRPDDIFQRTANLRSHDAIFGHLPGWFADWKQRD